MKTCTVPLNEVSETVDQPAGRPVGKHCQIGRRSYASSTAVSTLDPPGLVRLANPGLGATEENYFTPNLRSRGTQCNCLHVTFVCLYPFESVLVTRDLASLGPDYMSPYYYNTTKIQQKYFLKRKILKITH